MALSARLAEYVRLGNAEDAGDKTLGEGLRKNVERRKGRSYKYQKAVSLSWQELEPR
jgi:hypothetical protein